MAKPDYWDQMTDDRKQEIASGLLNSMRGRLVIGQALAHAVKVMREVEFPEISNIEDMEMIGEMIFSPWFQMYMDPDRDRPTEGDNRLARR